MKINYVYCPECYNIGKRTLLCKLENFKGEAILLLWCKKCRKEISVKIERK